MAVGLTADEASAAPPSSPRAHPTPDVPIPQRIDAEGWQAYADEAGALRSEHTQSRGTPRPGHRTHHLGLAQRR